MPPRTNRVRCGTMLADVAPGPAILVANEFLHKTEQDTLDDFEHVAHWDEQNEWIEMRLRSLRSGKPGDVTCPIQSASSPKWAIT